MITQTCLMTPRNRGGLLRPLLSPSLLGMGGRGGGNSPSKLGPRVCIHRPTAQQTLPSSLLLLPLHKALHLDSSHGVQPGSCTWALDKYVLQWSSKWWVRTLLRSADRFRDRLVKINASYLTHVPAGSRKPKRHGVTVTTVTIPAITTVCVYRVLHMPSTTHSFLLKVFRHISSFGLHNSPGREGLILR